MTSQCSPSSSSGTIVDRQSRLSPSPLQIRRRPLDQVAEAAAAGFVLGRDAAEVAIVGATGEKQEEGHEERRRPEHPYPAKPQDQRAAETHLERQRDRGDHDGRQQEVEPLDLDQLDERLRVERLDDAPEDQHGAQKGPAGPADNGEQGAQRPSRRGRAGLAAQLTRHGRLSSV